MSETELVCISGLSTNYKDYNILFSVISTGFFADAPARGGDGEAPVDRAAGLRFYRTNLAQAILGYNGLG
jgi:hypothetical protein